MTEAIQATQPNSNNEIIKFNPLSKAVLSGAREIFTPDDFIAINGRYETTRDAMLKLLTSLPIGYNLEITNKSLTKEYASLTVKLSVKFHATGIERVAECVGTCEMTEVKGLKTLHNLITRAETRAIKRAVETVFGAVVNALILEIKGGYEVGNYTTYK
jgi:hypothetical protein